MIQEVGELVQGLTQEIRTTSYLLYPPMLDEGGFSYALRWCVEGLVESSGLGVERKYSGQLRKGTVPPQIHARNSSERDAARGFNRSGLPTIFG